MKESSEHRQALTAIIFSNVGHGFSHMFTVLYATAVLYLPKVFDLPYGELLGLSSLGLVLFGVAALPAGWLGPVEPDRNDGYLFPRHWCGGNRCRIGSGT